MHSLPSWVFWPEWVVAAIVISLQLLCAGLLILGALAVGQALHRLFK